MYLAHTPGRTSLKRAGEATTIWREQRLKTFQSRRFVVKA